MFIALHLRDDLTIDERTKPVQTNSEELAEYAKASIVLVRKNMGLHEKPRLFENTLDELINQSNDLFFFRYS